MTLEEKEREYQQILVEDYKRKHPDETEYLTNEEIVLMNPLSNSDFLYLVGLELDGINKEIVEVLEDIDYCNDKLNDVTTPSNEKPDLRRDIAYDNKKLNELRMKFDNLKGILLERQENERNGSR